MGKTDTDRQRLFRERNKRRGMTDIRVSVSHQLKEKLKMLAVQEGTTLKMQVTKAIENHVADPTFKFDSK